MKGNIMKYYLSGLIYIFNEKTESLIKKTRLQLLLFSPDEFNLIAFLEFPSLAAGCLYVRG